MHKQQLRVGLIGCGAASELLHVPALLRNDRVSVVAAVDPDTNRSTRIAELTGCRVARELNEILGTIDAAIVALPHHLHSSVSCQLLSEKKHVLVEKPMAPTPEECDQMISAAGVNRVVLAVGQMRRFCPAVTAAKCMLERNVIGSPQTFGTREGVVYDWPVKSDAMFRRETAGGGVLIDTGAHTFDLILWLFGKCKDVEYYDDSCGGIEADCLVRLVTETGVSGEIELSRTRSLPSVLQVHGTEGQMWIDYRQNRLTLEVNGRRLDPMQMPTVLSNGLATNVWDLMFERQLENWVSAICDGKLLVVDGPEGKRVVEFIRHCYSIRLPLVLPWDVPIES